MTTLVKTDTQINNLRIQNKDYYAKCSQNLFVKVSKTGKKTFIYRGLFQGKEIKKKLGDFGVNFSLTKAFAIISDKEKLYSILSTSQNKDNAINNTFKSVCDEYMKTQDNLISLKQINTYTSLLERFVYPKLGKKDIKDIKKMEIIECVRLLEDKKETAKRLLQLLKRIYHYACMCDYVDSHIIYSLEAKTLVGVQNVKNFATLTDDKDLKRLFDIIAKADIITKCALTFNALTALRPGNIIKLKWDNIDFKNSLLIIDAKDMKTKKPFYLPLSKQALRVLEIAQKYKASDYVFYSKTSKSGHISDNTMRIFLRKKGITNDEFTPHGFRAMFSTIANDNNHSSEIIELCLAHAVGGVKGVYDRSHKLKAKKELMQWWGDYLEKFIKDFL